VFKFETSQEDVAYQAEAVALEDELRAALAPRELNSLELALVGGGMGNMLLQ
jgi:hypothetical protein